MKKIIFATVLIGAVSFVYGYVEGYAEELGISKKEALSRLIKPKNKK